MINPAILGTIIAGALFAAFPCSANVLIEKTLEDQISNADLVVMASAGEKTTCDFGSSKYHCVKLTKVETVRGEKIENDINLLIHWGVSEAAIECCEYESRYLLILTKFNDGNYIAYNGPFSVFKLDNSALFKR